MKEEDPDSEGGAVVVVTGSTVSTGTGKGSSELAVGGTGAVEAVDSGIEAGAVSVVDTSGLGSATTSGGSAGVEEEDEAPAFDSTAPTTISSKRASPLGPGGFRGPREVEAAEGSAMSIPVLTQRAALRRPAASCREKKIDALMNSMIKANTGAGWVL